MNLDLKTVLNYYNKLRIYILPVLILSILVGLIVLVYLPTFQDIQANDSKISKAQGQISTLTVKANLLKEYTNKNKFQELTNVKNSLAQAIATEPALSNTSSQIENMATNSGLVFASLSTGQPIVQQGVVTVTKNSVTGLEDDTYTFIFNGDSNSLSAYLTALYSNPRLFTISQFISTGLITPNTTTDNNLSNAKPTYTFYIDAYALNSSLGSNFVVPVSQKLTDPSSSSVYKMALSKATIPTPTPTP